MNNSPSPESPRLSCFKYPFEIDAEALWKKRMEDAPWLALGKHILLSFQGKAVREKYYADQVQRCEVFISMQKITYVESLIATMTAQAVRVETHKHTHEFNIFFRNKLAGELAQAMEASRNFILVLADHAKPLPDHPITQLIVARTADDVAVGYSQEHKEGFRINTPASQVLDPDMFRHDDHGLSGKEYLQMRSRQFAVFEHFANSNPDVIAYVTEQLNDK